MACVLSESHRPIQHLYLYVSALSKTPVAPLSTTLVFPRVLFNMRSRVGLVCSHPFVLASECRLPPLDPLQASEDHVPALVGRVLSFILIVLGTVVHVFSSDSLRSRSRAAGTTHRQLRCRTRVCTNAAPQNQKQIAHCKPRQGTLSSRTSALRLCTQLPRHLESRTHHNLSHPLLRLELLVVRVESLTPRFSSRGPEDSWHARRPRDTHCFLLK